MRKIKDVFFFIAFLITGSLIFSCFALYNKYPLVFPDTGTYIRYAFELIVPYDRPIMYSLFVRYTSLGSSLWLVVYAQGIIVTYLVFLCIKCLSEVTRPFLTSLIVITILSAFTGVSIYCSQLMPDIFTSITILSFILLVAIKNNTKKNTVILILILIASTCCHLSHLVVIFFMLIAYTIGYVYNRKNTESVFTKSKLIFISIVVFTSILSVPSIHYLFKGGFNFSKTSHIFTIARMSENGILKKFLNENCNGNSYMLCHYKDSLPNNSSVFLWDYNSPLYKTGGWDNSKNEYTRIIHETLTTPKFLYMQISEGLKAFLKQLVRIESGNLTPNLKGSPPHSVIDQHYNSEIGEYEIAEQYSGNFRNEYMREFNDKQLLFVLISGVSLLSIIIILMNNKTNLLLKDESRSILILIVLIITGIVANAFVCGALSVPDGRYQNRVIWLLPFLVILLLLKKDMRMLIIKKTLNFFREI